MQSNNNNLDFLATQAQTLDNNGTRGFWQQQAPPSPYMNNWNLSRLTPPVWMTLHPQDVSRMISTPRLSFDSQQRFPGFPQSPLSEAPQATTSTPPQTTRSLSSYQFRPKDSLIAALEYTKKMESAFNASSAASSPTSYEAFMYPTSTLKDPSTMNLESNNNRNSFPIHQRRSSSSSDLSDFSDVISVQPLFSSPTTKTRRLLPTAPTTTKSIELFPSPKIEGKRLKSIEGEADEGIVEEKCNNRNFNILNKVPSSPSSSPDSSKKGKRLEAFKGHRRLAIQFTCIGNLGKYPQTCGNGNQVLIPECLSGFHTAYHQRWKFEVSQSSHMFEKNGKKCICLKWTITNIANQTTHSTVETPKQAYIRMSHGRTIASKVFRNAMLAEAEDMEQSLVGETDECRISNVASLIKALRPKTFSEGLLVFGLQHECVQEKMSQMLSEQF